MIDTERKNKLDIALGHLNKAAALLGEINIKKPDYYSCPVIGLTYNVNSPGVIEVQMSGNSFPEEIAKLAQRKDFSKGYDQMVYRNINLKLFWLVDKEGSDQE